MGTQNKNPINEIFKQNDKNKDKELPDNEIKRVSGGFIYYPSAKDRLLTEAEYEFSEKLSCASMSHKGCKNPKKRMFGMSQDSAEKLIKLRKNRPVVTGFDDFYPG